ncbi:MAG: DUF4411 family protein [Deltaproteobacteria bacterium]|nr:DUF4411 family protein [Deltaproteobacteria bacterium]
MHVFDASSIIHAFDNYPLEQFPPLWNWMAEQIATEQLAIPFVAYEEVNAKVPECGKWLREQNVRRLEVTNAIIQDTLRIKGLLGIAGDAYHSKGVGENDILIIATARAWFSVLISDEERQPNVPRLPAKKKIPAVCAMPQVGVECISFIEYLRASGTVFR